jgi:hypothetical protein
MGDTERKVVGTMLGEDFGHGKFIRK